MRRPCGIGCGCSNRDRAVFRDVDRGAGLFRDGTNGCAALADHITDALRIDLHGVETRRELREFLTRVIQGGLHFSKNMHAAIAGLRQRNLHDFLGDALNLDVHLQCCHALLCAGDLEIHIA